MKDIDNDKLEFIRSNFEAVYGQKFFPFLFKSLLHSDPSFTISFGAEELYKCMDYFGCPVEVFSEIMGCSEPELRELLTYKEQLPQDISLRLSRVTMLLYLGEGKFGSIEAFLHWFKTLDKTPYNMLRQEEDYLKLVKDFL